MHRFEAFSPFWRKFNRLLSLVLAVVILVGTAYLLILTLSINSLDAEEQGNLEIDTMVPNPEEYDEPNIRIGLKYGSSVRETYLFTSSDQIVYGYNLYQDSEFVALGTAPLGEYKASIGRGYTIELIVFQDPDTDSSDFDAVIEKVREILGVYHQPIFPVCSVDKVF